MVEIDGRIASETGSIIHNLLGAHPAAGIESTPSNDSYFWSHFSEGTMMLHLQPSRVLGMMDGAMNKRLSKEGAEGAHALYKLFNDNWVTRNVQAQLDVIEDFLSKNTYFSGNDKIGEGDVRNPIPELTPVHDVLPPQHARVRHARRRVQGRAREQEVARRDARASGVVARPEAHGGGAEGAGQAVIGRVHAQVEYNSGQRAAVMRTGRRFWIWIWIWLWFWL